MERGLRFIVQAFEHVGGRLTPTRRDAVPSESAALRQAEALAARLPGAAAFKLVTSAEGETATVLGAFGDVPDEVAEGLAGG